MDTDETVARPSLQEGIKNSLDTPHGREGTRIDGFAGQDRGQVLVRRDRKQWPGKACHRRTQLPA
jgi:hypothetical protein